MMYSVIKSFTDLQDDGFLYRVGDKFPRTGKKVTDERIAELAGSDNLQRKPLIAAVDEPAAEVTAEEAEEAEEKPKRTRKRKS